ncbi:MAG: T9SS type A sorting domain-containing protein [Bacteroidetes bacterium]|nr:T9SS type A sorting domain-containing protein [Bacteroidota bacterium]
MRQILLLCSLMFIVFAAHAQQYKWITGGGSTDEMTPSGLWEKVSYMCTDGNGNVYATAIVGINDIRADTFYMNHPYNIYSTPNILLASYRCDGTMRWAKLFEAEYLAFSYGISYDDAGNIYCVGYMDGDDKSIDGDTVITGNKYNTEFVAKFDTSGNYKWIRFIGPDSLNTELGSGINSTLEVDGLGYIHDYTFLRPGIQITPTVRSVTGTYDIKFDSSGNIVSAIRMPIDSAMWIDYITINKKSNNIYVVVSQNNFSSGSYHEYFSALNSIDIPIWVDSFPANGGIGAIAYDGDNGIYASGGGTPFVVNTDTISIGTNVDIVKIDTNGHFKWLYGFSGMGNSGLLGITFLPNGNIAAAGILIYSLRHGNDSIVDFHGQEPLMVIMDSSGKLVKLDQLYGDGFYNWAMAIASDKNNNIYIGGMVSDSIWTGDKSYMSYGGNTDFFIAKYGYNCNCTSITEPTPMFAIARDSVNALTAMLFTYTGGITPDSIRWNFGDGTTSTATSPSHTFSDTGLFQVCLTTYACDSGTYCQSIRVLPPTGIASVNTFGNIKVYPNPMSGQLFIENAESGDKIRLYDIMGREVYVGIINNQKYFINTNDLSVGTYLLELTDKYGRRNSMTVVKQ